MSIKHHEAIKYALSHFNLSYLQEHNILFGGGTRIALDLDEYRTSIDIDFLCPNKKSYRAVRTQVSSNSLGELVASPLTFLREIRSDRDAVRTFIKSNGCNIKLEFVSFDNYNLQAEVQPKWNVPIIDVNSCFITKLLANADRFREPVKKDIVDLIKMYEAWGEPNNLVWDEVDSHYGSAGYNSLRDALNAIANDPLCLEKTFDVCEINPSESNNIIALATEWNELIEGSENFLTP